MSHYSHSAIESFKTCPLKYKLHYIVKPPIEKTTSIEAFLGSRVHETLEKLYKDLKHKKLNTLDDLFIFYEKIWNNNFKVEEIEIVRQEYTFENYKDLGKKYIKDYYQQHYPFKEGTTLGIEEKITLNFKDTITNKIYNVIGFIDRLTMITPEYFEIHDYKTNNKPKTQKQIEEDRQLALYSIAIKKMFPSVKKVGLVWHFLAANLEMRTFKEDFELQALEKEIIKDIRTIEKAKEKDEFPLKESPLCAWCAYKEYCPAKAHKIKVKKDVSLNDDGKLLVDDYLFLVNKKKELTKDLDKQIDDLKERIIYYSKQNNYERIYGSNSSVLVKEYESLKLPLKDTKEREVLEKLLKESGLWEEVSDVSYSGLASAISSGMFSEDFKENLLKHISFEKIYRMYVKEK
jgi:putative RecB family exonuclease